jgi:hypothetical protein
LRATWKGACKKLLIRFLLAFNPVLIFLSENARESPETQGHVPEWRKSLLETSVSTRDTTAQDLLSLFSDTENYPDEHLAPYQEFRIGANTYYFTPGGFLYRKDPGSEEVGGFFCGYLTDEVWHYRTDDG